MTEQQEQQGEGITLAQLLDQQIDPRDSESALAMYEWLRKNGRLTKVGSMDGVGYLFVYQEPKGTTREGYVAGGQMSERVIDKVLESQGDAEPPQVALCMKCLSPVSWRKGEVPQRQQVPEGRDPAVCDDGAEHVPHTS